MTEPHEIADLQEVYYRIEKMKQELNLLSDFVASKIQAEKPITDKPAVLLDPRTGQPFGK